MYSESQIYKLVCDDGFYYYGATNGKYLSNAYNSLKRTKHKYRHISELGWNRVRIELVEKFPCNSEVELQQRLMEYIRKDDDCLNIKDYARRFYAAKGRRRGITLEYGVFSVVK
jgi:hypothetical protein